MVDIHTSINVHPKEYTSLDAGCTSISSLERTSSGAIHRKLESKDRGVCQCVSVETLKESPKSARRQVKSSLTNILP